MTEDQQESASKALLMASSHLEAGRFLAAEAWSDHACTMITEANINARQLSRIVAPSESATAGDKVAITISAVVLLWMIADMIWDVL